MSAAHYRLKMRVYYEDTDAAGIVYHANYLKFMERARTEWLRSLGFEQDALAREHGIGFVVRSATLDFVRPARFNDELLSTVQVERCGRASVDLVQHVLHADGGLLCGGRVRVGAVHLGRMAPQAMPESVYLGIRNAY
ncbi:MAG TPA: tol-pal system-associated acyl-CoA thioesterase [Gammaproteobacteria bacterium]|nr:tol-pal system-associated acyl-CoA thioesterase [Gammaproteobacteria bacterium]